MRNVISSGAGFPLIGIYLATYIALQYSGLFGPRPDNIMRVLHQWPSLAGIVGLVLYGGVWGFMRGPGNGPPDVRFKRFAPFRYAYLGSILFTAGILLSSLTRFESRMILPEGQAVPLASGNIMAGTLYSRIFSNRPQVVSEVKQYLSDKGKRRGIQRATLLYRKSGSREPRELRAYSLIPTCHDGYTITIQDSGYSPNVFLFNQGGNVIENFYALLQLAPTGVEDFFRFEKTIPHTFYLRYYPDVSEVQSVAEASRIKSGPVFRVRIARNLDIVADRYVSPDEPVPFDALVFAAGDVKNWVEVQIVRDPGMYLVWPGIFLMICSVLAGVFRRQGLNPDE
jgi:hypothetical protein